MDVSPIEAETDHACILGTLTRRLAECVDLDRPTLAEGALDAMLRSGQFDRCCLPRYLALALAGRSGDRAIRIPLATEDDIRTRVIVWPAGSSDVAHAHGDGWTVFVPVVGRLVAVDERASATPCEELTPRRPMVLRGRDPARHRLRNQTSTIAMSLHVSGAR